MKQLAVLVIAAATAAASVGSVASAAAIARRQTSASVVLTVDPTNSSTNYFQVHAMLETNLNDSQISQWIAVGGASMSYNATGGITAEIPCAMTVAAGAAGIGIRNPGWAGGIGVLANTLYSTSFYARSDVAQAAPITVGLYDSNGNVLASSTFASAALNSTWTKFSTSFTPTTSTSGSSSWRLTFPSGLANSIQIAYTSLTPPDWNGMPIRADIGQAYADLKPTFIRTPGGNDVQGNSLALRYFWNRTIGDPIHRPGRVGTWTGYNTEGLGLHELLNFVEFVGAQPVLATFAGYSLDHTASPDFSVIAQEVVNELHYVTDASGPWAELRAANGRKDPWTVTKVEIGNEDGLGTGPNTYQQRWNNITGAIKTEFGDSRFELISTWTGIDGWPATDVHDYNFPDFFRNNWRRYDDYTRDGRVYYQDEFAVVNSGLGGDSENVYSGSHRLTYPTVDAALSEAIFMLGLERNGDIVHGAAYAPGGGSGVHYQWTPNLINFAPGNVTARSTSFFTQQGFSLYPTAANLNAVNASLAPESSLVYHQLGRAADGRL
ncbi:hypothetical protein HK405_008591, partial [Cladochytrium tenue]